MGKAPIGAHKTPEKLYKVPYEPVSDAREIIRRFADQHPSRKKGAHKMAGKPKPMPKPVKGGKGTKKGC